MRSASVRDLLRLSIERRTMESAPPRNDGNRWAEVNLGGFWQHEWLLSYIRCEGDIVIVLFRRASKSIYIEHWLAPTGAALSGMWTQRENLFATNSPLRK